MSQSLACIPTSWNEQPDHFLQLSPPPSIPAPPCPQYTVSKNNFGGLHNELKRGKNPFWPQNAKINVF